MEGQLQVSPHKNLTSVSKNVIASTFYVSMNYPSNYKISEETILDQLNIQRLTETKSISAPTPREIDNILSRFFQCRIQSLRAERLLVQEEAIVL